MFARRPDVHGLTARAEDLPAGSEYASRNRLMLSSGTRLGPYEIIEPVGAGGMGEVYKARDTRLNRVVAIKKGLTPFNERFEREAHAIASLNHPYICSLFDVGPDYLVMEYVEGRQLAGPLPLDEAVTVAGQILEAIDAAHRKGIVHRDLKPANILVTKSGVKLLDFGLAKASAELAANMATLAGPATGAGAIVGTLHYMSPEQVEARDADVRSDIFAFGLVLYELITGKRPFDGTSSGSIIASILKDQPQPIAELCPGTPKGIDRIVRTCLEKDPDQRWQSARDIKHALDWEMADAAAGRHEQQRVRPAFGMDSCVAGRDVRGAARCGGGSGCPALGKTAGAGSAGRRRDALPGDAASRFGLRDLCGALAGWHAAGLHGNRCRRDRQALDPGLGEPRRPRVAGHGRGAEPHLVSRQPAHRVRFQQSAEEDRHRRRTSAGLV